jgi:hypothetical protein
MTDLRERLARAICGITCKGFELEAAWPQYLPEADAALAELAPELGGQPQAALQASAEDVTMVDELVRQSGLAGPTIKDAWQRIRASLNQEGTQC